VSRVWRKVEGDWDAWNARSFAEEPIIRLILGGSVVRVRLDRKATAIELTPPSAGLEAGRPGRGALE
jgi:putative transposase